MKKRIRARHSKAASKFAMFVGIAFCCIGFFVVIPMAGPFGILWTAVAVYITYANYRDGFTDNPIGAYEIHVDDIENQSDSIEERLKKLDSLYNQGLITRDEYDEKRKQILNEI